MTPVPAFWEALDAVPGTTTDARDWRCRLGDEYSRIGRYLRRTGSLAEAIDCPSPGGDGCPRKVTKRSDGHWRAVCQSYHTRCDALDLTLDDVAVLALDRGMLTADLGKIFSITASQARIGDGRVLYLGEHAVAAGVSAPAFLILPGQQDPCGQDELQAAAVPASNAIILTPCRASLSPILRNRLVEAGHH